jgi:hypothetical protein
MNRGLLIVILVVLIGYYLKQNLKSVDNYTNIYTSNFTEQAQKVIEEELNKRYEQSLNPKITGVYNPVISSYGGEALEKSTNQLQKQFNDIRYKNTRPQTPETTELPAEKKVIIPAIDGDFFTYKANSSEVSKLTGLPIELSPDTQPFFSKLTQNVENFDSGRLDHSLGNSLSFKPKDAVERFTDGYTVTNANMSQVIYTDHVDKNRFIPSIYHQGVPVVQPVLNAKPTLGTLENKAYARTGVKTLEELRPVQTKASVAFDPVKGTNNVNQTRGELGNVTKEKIKSFKENTFDDYYKGPGGYIAHKSEETFNVKDTSKVYYSDREGALKGYDNPQSRFDKEDGFRPVLKSVYTPISANATGTSKMMKGELTNYSSVSTTRETLPGLPSGNPHKNSKGIVLPQEVSLRTLREDFTAKPLANPIGPHKGSLDDSRNNGLINYNAQTTTKEIGLKGYIGGMKKDQFGNYLTESYDPKTTLKQLTLLQDKLGLATDTKLGTISYEGNNNYQDDKAIIKEQVVANRTPNKSSNLGNGNISLSNVTLKEYINRPNPLYYQGTSIITGVDNFGTRETSDKIIGGIDRLPPMKSNHIQDFNRIEST